MSERPPVSARNLDSVPQLFSLDEVAERLGMQRRWFERAVQERLIPCYRLGRHIRVEQSDIAAFVRSRRVEAVEPLVEEDVR